LPLVAEWERQMRDYGRQRGEVFDPATNPEIAANLGNYYYDSAWVFFQIADHLGEPEPWQTYARWALRIYREAYLVPNDFTTSGYWRFPHGLLEDRRRGGQTTLAEIEALRDRPAFSTASVLLRSYGDSMASGYNQGLSREVAYALQANIAAERAGSSRVIEEERPRVHWLVEFAENHLAEWRSQTFHKPDGRFAPFMFGLTAMALIEFVEWEEANGRDANAAWPRDHWPDVQTAIADFATWMRLDAKARGGDLDGQRMWTYQSYKEGDFPTLRYQDRSDKNGSPTPAADLNLLIAPVYAWLYTRTGNAMFRDAADGLFAAAVANKGAAFSGKHFNQHFRHSIQFVAWRAAGDAAHCP
jgi:hypothetical protein